MKKYIKHFSLVMVLLITGCKSDNTTENNYKFKNDKQLIKSIVETIITPAINDFKTATEKTSQLINEYANNLTTENLEKVKNQWKITSKQYANIYAFNIGEIKDKFLRLRLYNWPSTNNAIENYIKSREINETTVKDFGTSAKGLAGIEYLIFSESAEETNNKMKADTKRIQFLDLIGKELNENAQLQLNLWNTYGKNLIENEKDGLESSFNILFNGINNVIHYANETKIGKPAGLLKSKHINVEILQAYFSENSLELIEENVKSVRNLFFNNDIISITDKIEFVTKNDKLNNKLEVQFTNVLKAIDAINTPLKNAVYNEKEAVKKLFEELKKLEVLFTVDVSSTLSLIITGTDGDGD